MLEQENYKKDWKCFSFILLLASLILYFLAVFFYLKNEDNVLVPYGVNAGSLLFSFFCSMRKGVFRIPSNVLPKAKKRAVFFFLFLLAYSIFTVIIGVLQITKAIILSSFCKMLLSIAIPIVFSIITSLFFGFISDNSAKEARKKPKRKKRKK